MKYRISARAVRWIGWGIGIVLLLVGALLYERWLPSVQNWVVGRIAAFRGSSATGGDDDGSSHDEHDGHDHGDHGHAHDEASWLDLSPAAMRNIGLTPEYLQPVKLTTYAKSITVPALVVERPGRTHIQVATPLTGVVTHVHSVTGEAIEPGTLLFRLRLTHEDLVVAQTELLRLLGELDVELREITRLKGITESGAVAGRVLLEKEYARDRLQAQLSAQREALRLHGLSAEQVERIANDRRLLRDLEIYAPMPDTHDEDEFRLTERPIRPTSFSAQEGDPPPTPAHAVRTPLILRNLRVHAGQSVRAGETLCTLSDYEELFIEGLAFEQDAASIAQAATRNWTVTAVFDRPGDETEIVEALRIVRLDHEIDSESRTLRFYVLLPNTIEDRTIGPDANRFVSWRFRPGQRLRLRVPVEEWPNQIVLPVEAVASEGAESYIFQQNGDHFDRIAVHVLHRDQEFAVIAIDGAVFSGDVVALRGAHQMQMALRNKAGGAVDPHAGHNH
ncbi:MAG: efflux RND transporter periplasmic adaptor subunit [Planctomycetaceae bacterium]